MPYFVEILTQIIIYKTLKINALMMRAVQQEPTESIDSRLKYPLKHSVTP